MVLCVAQYHISSYICGANNFKVYQSAGKATGREGENSEK